MWSAHFWEMGLHDINDVALRTTDFLIPHHHLPSGLPCCPHPGGTISIIFHVNGGHWNCATQQRCFLPKEKCQEGWATIHFNLYSNIYSTTICGELLSVEILLLKMSETQFNLT